MPYKENLSKAIELKKELDTFRPLSNEIEQRIMQKFRLDWNYHSSNIEGNKLTYGETKALLLFGVTAQAKPLHDHLEMQGHNEAIKWLEEIIKNERPLTESFIRELHKLILVEPYEVPAQTPDGKPSTRMITIGQYKSVPNHVKTITGEIFYFATPEETPAKMSDLMKWYNTEAANPASNPILLAIEFHYRFIRIHPFDDGNGRMARLLMNFILMKYGYPPAIVKTQDKENYFAALRQADAGELAYFFDYVTSLVNHSLELMIRGAKGENIDEPDDLDKQLALLKQEMEAEDENNEIKLELTDTVFWDAIETWGDTLLLKLINTTVKFNEFYSNNKHHLSFMIEGKGHGAGFSSNYDLASIRNIHPRNRSKISIREAYAELSASFGAYKKGGLNPFGCQYRVKIEFDKYHYKVIYPRFENGTGKQQNRELQKLLHQPLTEEEITDINKIWGDTLLQHLVTNRDKLKNKE